MDVLPPVISRLLEGILLIIVGWLLAWICKKGYEWLRFSRPVSKVLGTLADSAKKVIIVVPKLYSNQTSMLKEPLNPKQRILWNKAFALFAEGDSKAVMYLYRFLLGLGKGKNKLGIKSDSELSGKERGRELICIGAGSNEVTKDVLRKVNPRVNFGQGTIPIRGGSIQLFGVSIIDQQTNETWTANPNDDYGLIVRLRNPSNLNADMMILAGLGPSGTAGAGYYLSTKWKEIYDYLKMKNAFDKNYEVLVKTKQKDHTDLTPIKTVII